MISIRTGFWLLMFVMPGCAGIGPVAVANGRSVYNTVINQTEDEQILSIIVRQRYDETFAMLAVSSVTANLKVTGSVGANVGLGPRSGYEGNLVPLSAGAIYEDNPTISYVPLRGEQFVERMLSPITAEHALLLDRMSTDQVEVLRYLLRRANGLVNPRYSSLSAATDFDHFIDLFSRLRDAGKLDIVRSGNGEFQMLLHDYAAEDSGDVGELLRMLGVRVEHEGKAQFTVPIRFFVGARRTDGIDLETPSALEVIGAAALGVEVPKMHLADGLARRSRTPTQHELVAIHSSKDRPSYASVAVMHRGWWFYVDGRDARSKQGFMVLRTLIGLRLDETTAGQRSPVLTVPVSR